VGISGDLFGHLLVIFHGSLCRRFSDRV